MDVIFYGRLADRAGPRVNVHVPDNGCCVAALRALIADQHPDISAEISSPRVRACIDDMIVGEGQPVGGAHSVEFFPPVSGG
ncbi:MoaD/ThiS family protein [Sphingomonas sp. GCM10030256]|uniref:MoaD/ThiS family protein n=1 Tax=Sphingomonas sp. GCM10030256 TaxID=3273427 RepID=UPI0036202B54